MSKTQSAADQKAKVPSAAKAARQLPAGAVLGPKGKKLVDTKPEDSEPSVPPQPEVTDEQRAAEIEQQKANVVMQFSATQLAAPAAHQPELSQADQNQLKFLVEVKSLAEKMGVNVPQLVNKALRSSDKVAHNGITRPAAETVTGKVWEAADDISRSQARHATMAEVKAHPITKDINIHTVKTQYARWRQFNGVKGRLAKPDPQAPSKVTITKPAEEQAEAPAAE